MWRTLCERGLRRCLFGVESGVSSILRRFNKETTSDQNALAIRTLSALARYTYITFDHLMTAEELLATHAFQARTDLLLQPLLLGKGQLISSSGAGGCAMPAAVNTRSCPHRPTVASHLLWWVGQQLGQLCRRQPEH